jgi:hypothetical protein
MRVAEALAGSFRMIKERPRLVLPALVPVILVAAIACLAMMSGIPLGLDYDGTFQASLDEASASALWLIILLTIVLSVVDTLISGMYPTLVVSIIKSKEPDLMEALRFSYHRFWSLLGASVIAGLVSGLVASAITALMAIPAMFTGNDTGILERVITTVASLFIGALFYYAVPAIIMDGYGAVEGVRTSWNLSRNRYLRTLLLLAVPSLASSLISALFVYLPYAIYASEMSALLMLIPWCVVSAFVHAWTLTIPAYAYQDLMNANSAGLA